MLGANDPSHGFRSRSPELARKWTIYVNADRLASMTPPIAGPSRWALANRSADTKHEVAIRKRLHSMGYRFRTHLPLATKGCRVRPDIVFPRRRLAIFIDGCYWHGCTVHGGQPESNAEYWRAKRAHNKQRDERVNLSLIGAGWKVLRIWEHVNVATAATLIVSELDVL